MPFALVLASDTATVAVPLEYPTLTGDVPATITAPLVPEALSAILIVAVPELYPTLAGALPATITAPLVSAALSAKFTVTVPEVPPPDKFVPAVTPSMSPLPSAPL